MSARTPTLARDILRWRNCDPEAMAYHQSQAAIKFAFIDAKHDVLLLNDQRAELLAALEQAVEYLKPRVVGGVRGTALMPKLLAALAKATGEVLP